MLAQGRGAGFIGGASLSSAGLETGIDMSDVFLFICGMCVMWAAEKLGLVGKRNKHGATEECKKTE